MNQPRWQPEDYARVEKAILFLEDNLEARPSLDDVAAQVHISKYHFQRMFSRWAGVSPKRFMQYLTLSHAKELLADSRSVLDAALESGLSGPGRLHDLFVALDAATPGEFKSQGEGVTIRYGWHPSPFGECLLAATERGICTLSFLHGTGRAAALAALRASWARATLVEDAAATASLAARAFAERPAAGGEPLRLSPRGTPFQVKVWEALLAIPPGAVASYRDVAALAGAPKATRAAASAVAANPVAFLIPCHRVIRKVGGFGNYRWGAARKKAILAWEQGHAERQAG